MNLLKEREDGRNHFRADLGKVEDVWVKEDGEEVEDSTEGGGGGSGGLCVTIMECDLGQGEKMIDCVSLRPEGEYKGLEVEEDEGAPGVEDVSVVIAEANGDWKG